MPSLLCFGAGNIGRGFIAPLFAAAAPPWTITFVEVDPRRLAALRQRGGYRLRLVAASGATQEQAVTAVTAVDGRDRDAVVAALRDCDLAATAVGVGNLPHLAASLAAALVQRQRPLDVLVCENGIDAADRLRAAVAALLPGGEGDPALARLGCVRTSIGRMIPPPPADADPLDCTVEPYAHLPVAQADFVGDPPTRVPGLEPEADFALALHRKLYLHNASHAALAYLGLQRGYRTVPQAAADRQLVARIRRACDPISEAIAHAHAADDAGRARIRQTNRRLLDGLLDRYRNELLADPLRRVARDPLRKFAPGDRLLGAAELCRTQRVPWPALALVIVDACRYDASDDEPQAETWNAAASRGWRVALTTAGLPPEDPLMTELAHADRRREAAAHIQAAGILLRDDEVETIEIADFGLGRFEELGLAIHVYVNTDRCCAKELAMLPGQICPEHRHPDVDGEPGKEETFRVRAGVCHLFVPGTPASEGKASAERFWPADKRDRFTVCHELELHPGDQYTIAPNTPHWFVAGPEGCVISEFSTRSTDECDVFTDPEIQRVPDDV